MAGIKICRCPYGIGNFGTVKCPNLMDAVYRMILVPRFKADGTINSLDLTDVDELDDTFFEALINDDQDVAWRPTGQLLNFESVRAEQQFEEFNEGNVSIAVQKGKRSVKFVLAEVAPALVHKFDGANCDDLGVFFIDENGSLWGEYGGEYILNPIPIQKRSMYANLIWTGQKTVQKIMVGFTIDPTFRDGDLKGINAEDTTYDLRHIPMLIDADIVLDPTVAQTNTGFKLLVDTFQGSVFKPELVPGLTKPDFTYTRLDTGAAVVITTVTEPEDGKYVFVVPAQVAGVHYLIEAVKDGFNLYSLEIVGV